MSVLEPRLPRVQVFAKATIALSSPAGKPGQDQRTRDAGQRSGNRVGPRFELLDVPTPRRNEMGCVAL